MYSSLISQPSQDAIDPYDLLITQRVREIVEAGNLSQGELAKELGISQPHVSRLLQGKTPWRKRYLQRISDLYKISLKTLLLDAEDVPIVSLISDDQGFSYNDTEDQTAWLGKVVAPPGEPDPQEMYCIQIQGEFFRPFFSSGSLLYVRRDSKNIQEDGLVIYVDDDGRGLLRQVKFANDTIILKSLSPSGQYIIRPKTHLRLLDKVEWIKI